MADYDHGLYLSGDSGSTFDQVWAGTGATLAAITHTPTGQSLVPVYWMARYAGTGSLCDLYRATGDPTAWQRETPYTWPHAVRLPVIPLVSKSTNPH